MILYSKSYKYRRIEKKAIDMNTAQKSGHANINQENKSELYNKDVQIISKDGKLYYLPESRTE